MVTCNIVILYLWNLAFKSSETGLGVYCFVFIYLDSSGSDPSHVRCTLYPGDQTGLDVNVRLSPIAHSYLLDLRPRWKGIKASCIIDGNSGTSGLPVDFYSWGTLSLTNCGSSRPRCGRVHPPLCPRLSHL